MKRVGVVGPSGFTGKECLRLLCRHPEVEVVARMSARADPAEPERYPGALGEPDVEPFDAAQLAGLDAVFVCAPHEVSARIVPSLLEQAGIVIDLSAAFRLRDPGLYEAHYGFVHPNPELLGTAVYGLTEWARQPLSGARLIANPGCYVTAVLLPLKALLRAGCIAPDSDLIADCKSGVSGAGKGAGAATHFASVHDDFRAYAAGTHRHEPEMRQELDSSRLFFTPHLLPVFRGIFATIHVEPAAGMDAADLRRALAVRYQDEPFVHVHAAGEELPCLSLVRGTNSCRIGVAAAGRRAVVVSCLDNLVKGAAGQAVQNLNVACGLDETAGLDAGDPDLAGWR